MKKNFTKLVCVGLGIVLNILFLSGQNAKQIQLSGENSVFNSMGMQEKVFFLQQEIIPRKGENKMPEVMPDSIITFSTEGEKVNKKFIQQNIPMKT